MRKIFIMLFFLAISTASANDASSVFADLSAKLKNAKTIKIEFTDGMYTDIHGKIIAAKGNKYKLYAESRIIVCDGKTIWNYSPIDSTVLISDFDPEISEFSIETLFFNLVNSYKPVKLTETKSSRGQKDLVLHLEPIGQENDFSFGKIRLFLDSGLDRINYIEVEPGTGEVLSWEIHSLKIDSDLKADTFQFDIPKDCEVIDFRTD